MVHSSSTPPMKTPPSSTVPATAPSLQVDPLVPPPGDTTDKHLNQIPHKSQLKDFTSNSHLTSPTLCDAPTPVTSVADLSSPSPLAPSQAPCSAQASINGRTSGRKRTPKACDCCGPNSAGHNVTTPGRGRGKGRGRGRGRGGRGRARGGSSSSTSELWHTPKRKVQGQWTHVKIFEDTNKGDSSSEEMQMSETYEKSITTEILAVTPPEKEDTHGKDDTLAEDGHLGEELSEGTSAGAGEDEDGAPVTQAEGGIAKVSDNSCATPVLPQLGSVGPSQGAPASLAGRPDEIPFKRPLLNGDTVSLSDSEPEEEAAANGMMNGQGAAGCQVQDLDLDLTLDKTTAESETSRLCGDSEGISADEEQCCISKDMEASHLPSFQGPIVVSLSQHLWALRDHRLYCGPGTWMKDETEDAVTGSDGMKVNGKLQDEEDTRELLIDLIQEFLESSYMKYGSFIPLSENDVVEYLKNKGNSDLSSSGVDIKKEMTRYRVGLASAPIAGFMVTYNKHTLGLEDLGTLEDQNWLNDQIINMYGELIMEATQQKVHFFNSFFHKQLVAKGYDGVKRWTKKVDLFSKWLLLIPIHLEIHWSLITVTMATKTISYYDSQGIVFRHTTDNILKYLLSEAKEKNQTAFQKGWKITIIKGIPQQKNDSDCGVFVLEYCRCLSVKQPLLFSQEDMPRIRKRIYKELCECRLED